MSVKRLGLIISKACRSSTFGIAAGIGFCSRRWIGSSQRPSCQFGTLTWGGCRREGALPGRPQWRAPSKDRVGRRPPNALTTTGKILLPGVDRYQIDLLNLGREDEWDIAFMLDLIEHTLDDIRVVRQTAKALKPGALLFVAAPKFQRFWSYNDELANHFCHYARSDFGATAEQTSLKLLDSRYFMFFLIQLYLLSRLKPGFDKLSEEEKRKVVEGQNKVRAASLNAALTAVFAAETPVGHWLSFPWGTSLLGGFQKQ